jgi:uncharacterized protein YjbI with pentapeptide repeats
MLLGSDLSGGWLCRTVLEHANLDEAKLEGSHFDGTTSFPEGLDAAARGALDDGACNNAAFVSGCERPEGLEAPASRPAP